MDINLIITIVVYCLFFISLLIGFFIGLARGLKKSSLRLGSLVLFVIIGGLITPVISKALLTINLSSFNININGQIVTTIPELIQNSLFSIQGFQEAAESMPSIMTLVEGLPVAVMNVVVFTLLIFIMSSLSWILYTILSHTVLKETKLEKQIKKQRKLEKRNKEIKTNPQLAPNQKPQAIPLGKPNKRRLLGALVGTVQGFIFLFLVMIPITSLMGSFGEVMSGPDLIDNENSLAVYAEENELLSEYSSDIIKNALGEEVVSYFETFNNSIPTKILTIGGLNNSIFDALSSLKVNGENIAIRKDAVTATKIYDSYMMIMEEIGQNEQISDINFEVVRNAVDMVFKTGLFRAFAEEAIPYALDMALTSESFTEMEYSNEIQDALVLLIESYTDDPVGFINSFKNDVSVLLDIAESALDCGLVDQAVTDPSDYDSLIDTFKDTDYKFLSDFSDNAYDSYLFRILTSKGLNIGLDIASNELSNDTTIDFGTTDYEQINWTSVKSSVFGFLKNTLDIYDIVSLYGIDNVIANPKNLISVISSEDINDLFTLFGKELDFIKDSPLFAGQTNTPVKGLINWLGNNSNETLTQLIDTPAMLELESWEIELNSLSNSMTGLKDSGALDLILAENFGDNLNVFIETLLDPVSEESSADTYLRQILTPIISSSITKKLIVYGLNQVNSGLSGIVVNDFTTESLTPDQNNDIILIAESFANCFSILTVQPIDLSTIDTTKLSNLLTALQSNAFRKGTASELDNSNVNLTQKTITGGGIFANYYITLVTYIVGDQISINYKNINWLGFFESAQSLSGNITEIIEGSLEDFVNLGDETTQEDLENLLDSLGLDGGIVSDLANIQGAVAGLTEGNLSEEEAYNIINNALENILNSTDEEGTPTIDVIINMIQTITEEDLSDKISTEIIANEQAVSNRLYLMAGTYSPINPLNYTDSALDSIHTEMTVLDATILDLTCGATYVLQQAVNSGTKIFVTNIDTITLTEKINTATTNEEIRTLVSSLFEII